MFYHPVTKKINPLPSWVHTIEVTHSFFGMSNQHRRWCYIQSLTFFWDFLSSFLFWGTQQAKLSRSFFCFQSLVLYLVYQLWWTLIVELLWNKNGLPYVYVWLLRNWRKKERRMKLKHNISFLSFLFILVSVH